MDYIRSLSVSIGDLQKYLAECSQPFEKSELYASAKQEKFVDEDTRKSVFRSVTDPKLFDLVETSVVSDLNKTDSSYQYILCRNDVTHIKYGPGGFFKRHKDYLSTTSNLLEEFTMIVCVTPACSNNNKVAEGGDTKIHFYGGKTKSFNTSTPGCGIVFRKDLEHEGTLLKTGEKHILTANLWGVRKEMSSQVLLVTFPSVDDTSEVPQETKKLASVREVADDSCNYVLLVDNLTGMLAAHVEWANRLAEQNGDPIPPVVTYECTDFDYEAFGIVVKILNRSYVNECEILEHSECLDYFGPFKAENVLVDLAVQSNADKDSKGTTATKVRPRKKTKVKMTKTESNTAKTDSMLDTKVIVCENEARMKAVCSVARALKEPYVPFKMLFVEGVLTFEGEGEREAIKIPMLPAACLVGDYNNLFILQKVCSKSNPSVRSLSATHRKNNYAKENETSLTDIELREIEYDEDLNLNDGCGFGLQFAFKDADTDVKYLTLEQVLDHDISCELRPLPGVTRDRKPPAKEERECTTKKLSSGPASLFHINSEGKVAFSFDEANAASDFIASLGLEERVKRCLQKKRFELPQHFGDIDADFCNEQVYGKVNILWVCGALRMEDSDSDSSDQKSNVGTEDDEFDAWPSAKQKKKMVSKMKRFRQYND